jgi:hypothetical protein
VNLDDHYTPDGSEGDTHKAPAERCDTCGRFVAWSDFEFVRSGAMINGAHISFSHWGHKAGTGCRKAEATNTEAPNG